VEPVEVGGIDNTSNEGGLAEDGTSIGVDGGQTDAYSDEAGTKDAKDALLVDTAIAS
jgi:hypothetical protein